MFPVGKVFIAKLSEIFQSVLILVIAEKLEALIKEVLFLTRGKRLADDLPVVIGNEIRLYAGDKL